MTGTTNIGKNHASEAAFNSLFCIFGVENLCMANMSVVPVPTNNYTQATAYMTGAICADIFIGGYGSNY